MKRGSAPSASDTWTFHGLPGTAPAFAPLAMGRSFVKPGLEQTRRPPEAGQ
jgi:hypothetical protein